MREASIVLVDMRRSLGCRPGAFLLLKRKETDKVHTGWCMPGGHREDGEGFREAAIRETKEETGYDVRIIWHIYRRPFIVGEVEFLISAYYARPVSGELLAFPSKEHDECRIVYPDCGLLSSGGPAWFALKWFRAASVHQWRQQYVHNVRGSRGKR